MVSKVKSRQRQSFLEELYVHYKVPLMHAVHSYIDDPNVQEDIFHEIFIRIIRKSDLLYTLPKPKLDAYIYLIAKGVSIDYLRKKYADRQVDIADDVLLNLLAQQDNLAAVHMDSFKKADLSLMLANLSVEDQILLVGKYYLGLSVNDLVDIVGGTSTAIRSKLHRVRKKVFTEWTKAGLTMEDFLNE